MPRVRDATARCAPDAMRCHDAAAMFCCYATLFMLIILLPRAPRQLSMFAMPLPTNTYTTADVDVLICRHALMLSFQSFSALMMRAPC